MRLRVARKVMKWSGLVVMFHRRSTYYRAKAIARRRWLRKVRWDLTVGWL